MKRFKPEQGPRFTIETGDIPLTTSVHRREAKHPGEYLALIEAQSEAEKAEHPMMARVLDVEGDDVQVVFVVTRGEDGTVTTA